MLYTPGGMGGRAAIYLRVSKGERHTDNQRPDDGRMPHGSAT